MKIKVKECLNRWSLIIYQRFLKIIFHLIQAIELVLFYKFHFLANLYLNSFTLIIDFLLVLLNHLIIKAIHVIYFIIRTLNFYFFIGRNVFILCYFFVKIIFSKLI